MSVLRRPARGRATRAGLALAVALAALAGLASAGVSLALDSSLSDCQETTITASSEADAWIGENETSNKGFDAVMNVAANPSSGNSRALVRFRLPSGVPEGCVVESAMLRLYTTESSEGSRVEALRLASGWSEGSVIWSNQPGTTGSASTIWSRQGYMQWRVASQVQAMFEGGNHGFLIRDAAEGTIEGGGGHGFYGREKGENPPELVIRFAAPSSGELPGPPEPPAPAAVRCGQVLTQSTQVTNDLSECLGDGLVIGADRIIVDLGGHTIDGVGQGTGILNDGYASVTVKNGTVQHFDYGVELLPETKLNVVERLTLQLNELAAIELFDAEGNEVRENTVSNNGDGIALVSGTRGSVVVDNTMTLNSGAGLLVVDSNANRLERNNVSGGGDLGIGLERASENTLLGNSVSNNSDGGIEIRHGSNGNRVESNEVSESGDTGIMVDESDRTELISNTTRLMSDAGITLNSANDGIVRDNDLRFSPGGLQVDGSSRNLIESNDASDSSGIGIELGGGSYDNFIVLNTANGNGATGIYVADEALTEPGNLLYGNTASGNRADGIVVAKGGHTITANVVRDNSSWGINAVGENIDGLGNVATGNGQAAQCSGVRCKAEWIPPETSIDDRPDDSTSSSSARFTFTGSDDTTLPSALRFQCRLDSDDDADFKACSSPRSYTGLSTGTYTFEVRAIDRADNVDPTPASYTWTVDTTPPETTIDSGPDAITRSTSATFRFSANEPGSTFECSLDSTPFAPCTSPADYSELVAGTHAFRVRATDRAGNADSEPATYAWTVDTTPPQTTIEAGPNAQTNTRSASFSFSADEQGSTFECSLDGAAAETCVSPAEYSGLADGPHRFQVRATDQVGNVEPEPATYEWTIDATPPETRIDSGPADPTNRTSASFGFSADELGATFECSLDDRPFAACLSPADYTGLNPGAHVFRVRATDRAGNLEPDPTSYAWTIDTRPPETRIDSGPDAQIKSTSATFGFSSDEEGSTFECSLDGAAFAACTSPAEYSDLAPREHVFRVRAIDRAGNSDPEPAGYAWTIDTRPPETRIDSGPDAQTNSTSASFSFSADEPGSAFECSLDDAPFAPCISPATLADLTPGSHTFEVRATDRAGNLDPEPARYSWTVDTSPPDTSIGDRPPDPTNQSAASLAFAGSDNLDAAEQLSFQCRLDHPASDWAACTSPTSYSGLAEGGHSFEVRATDRAGNVGAPASHAWTIDLTAPASSLSERPADPTNSSSARFAFGGSDNLSAPAELDFQCRRDSAAESAWQPCTSPLDYHELAEGGHGFEVRAIDAAGNVGAPASHAWTIDLTAPQTTIDSGPDARTTSSSARFSFSADESSSFECSLDGATFAPCVSPADYTDLQPATHTFRVQATDRAGNTDLEPAVYHWAIEAADSPPPDTTPPDTSIDDRPADPTNSTSASFTFAGTDSETPPSLIEFECRLDSVEAAGWMDCFSPRSHSGLSPGSHTFEVRAIDGAGNADPEPASYSWTVDTTAPQTTIDTGPPAITSSTSASFTFSASEPGSTFECSLDSAAFATCTSPRQYSGLAAAAHQFQVRAKDPAGNTDATPAAHSWTIDTTSPQTTIDSGPPATTTSTSATFAFSATETGSTFECSLDGAAFAGCTSPREYTGLAVGGHDFRVRAKDPAGNTDATPAAHSWTIDTTSPQTSIDSGPPATTTSTSATFAFSASEAGSTFECSLDSAPFATCTSPREYTGLAAGTHQFRVRAKDAAGNLDGSPASYSWTIQAPGSCAGPSTVTAGANADSWVLQSSSSSNYGNDSVVKVDTKAGANARVLFRFALPAIPSGCQVTDARLRLFASSYKEGRTLHALRLGASWTESGVTWSNQPATAGAAATAASPSTSSYVQWSVTVQVQSMYSSGNHGFLVRDSVESGNGIEQAFHSREKAPDNPPQLVITFG